MKNPNSQLKILIADDSPTVTGILTYLFSEEGFQVESACDGVEAIELFFKNPPDLVVLDIEMPRMNGYQVCRILKDDPIMRQVPIIILTSRDLQSDRFHGLSTGANAYIVKDLEDDRLLVKVREMVKQSPWRDAPKPAARIMKGDEILSRVNQILDRRLFVSGIVSRLQDINAHVDSLNKTVEGVLDSFSKVFEFVVGGLLLRIGDRWQGFTCTLEGFGAGYVESFKEYLGDTLQQETGVGTGLLIEWQSESFSGVSIRNFPQTDSLTSRIAWQLKSHGHLVGLIGMGSPSPINFDQEGKEILDSFLINSALVLDNAALVLHQNETNELLSKALSDLKDAQSQLVHSEKMASLGQMMAGLVHEMNNPLNFVSGNIDHVRRFSEGIMQLVDGCIDSYGGNIPVDIASIMKSIDLDFLREDVPVIIKDCREGVDRAKRIINDLRMFSAPDRGGTYLTDLKDLIESTLNILRHEWDQSVIIEKNYNKIPEIVCNSGQVGQVILNLLSNATHSVKEKGVLGKISIEIRESGDFVELSVSDTGTGIAEENMDKLFQPFFTTKEVGSGMGLGLSITHGIIERHGGSISVTSREGEGTEFVVRLPIAGVG